MENFSILPKSHQMLDPEGLKEPEKTWNTCAAWLTQNGVNQHVVAGTENLQEL